MKKLALAVLLALTVIISGSAAVSAVTASIAYAYPGGNSP